MPLTPEQIHRWKAVRLRETLDLFGWSKTRRANSLIPRRMGALIADADAEADDEFWGQDALKEARQQPRSADAFLAESASHSSQSCAAAGSRG